jgi:hypothetical protein
MPFLMPMLKESHRRALCVLCSVDLSVKHMPRLAVLMAALVASGSVPASDSLDVDRPLFTREGALACPSLNTYFLASEARDHGWVFVPVAGAQRIPKGMSAGKPTSPETFQCTVYRDGVPAALTQRAFGEFATNLGWIQKRDLRN